MALIVEDGTGLPDANSYCDLGALRTYNALRGTTLPSDDTELQALAIQAMDYLLTFESLWKGDRATETQALAWPRAGVKANGTAVKSTIVPVAVSSAQAMLVGVATLVDLAGVTDTLTVTKEVIGPIETDYDASTGARPGPRIPLLNALLRPYLSPSAGLLTVTRV